MNMRLSCTCAALSLVICASPASAAIPFTYGSVASLSERSCAAVSSSTICDGAGPGQKVIQSQTTGGIGKLANSVLSTTADGSHATGFVTLDPLANGSKIEAPQIHASSYAGDSERINSNVIAFQSFTWTGDIPTPLSFLGNVHIDDASNSVPDTDDTLGGLLPGGSGYTANLLIFDPSKVAGLNTDNFFSYFGSGCGDAGVLGASPNGGSGGSLNGGATYSLSTQACSSGSLNLTKGQTVVLAMTFQLPTNRGGFADATNTFSVQLDPTLGAANISSLEENLVSGVPISAVPEPSVWLMMIVGFGSIGVMLRRALRTRAPALPTKSFGLLAS